MDKRSFPEGHELSEESGFKSINLRSVATGRGISIGDRPETILRVMGAPTWKGSSKYVSGEKVWSYHRIVGTKDDGTEYTSLFRLRKGKVAEIELHIDQLGGG